MLTSSAQPHDLNVYANGAGDAGASGASQEGVYEEDTRQGSIPPSLYSTWHVPDEVVAYSTAVELASHSGMPFGQRGYGASLTTGEVRIASSNAHMERDGSFAARTGMKRKREGAAARGPKINASLATAAFPRLATSVEFCSRLKSDIDALVSSTLGRWTALMNVRCTGPPARSSWHPSLMHLVEEQWRAHGWAYVHVAVGEDPVTRKSFHDGITRAFVERLGSDLSAVIDIALMRGCDTAPSLGERVLRSCILLFLLYLFWATAPPVVDETVLHIREPEGLAPLRPVPGITPQQPASDPGPPEIAADDFRRRIGRAWRIPIEADILAHLSHLPHLANKWVECPSDVSTSAQVNAVLYALSYHPPPTPIPSHPRTSGAHHSTPVLWAHPAPSESERPPSPDTRGGAQASGSAWAILPPRSEGPARSPLIVPDNWLCTEGENDVLEKKWGVMKVDLRTDVQNQQGSLITPGLEIPLTRQQRARAVALQHLEEEQFFAPSTHQEASCTRNEAQETDEEHEKPGLRRRYRVAVDPISTSHITHHARRACLRIPSRPADVPRECEVPGMARDPLDLGLDLGLDLDLGPNLDLGGSSNATASRRTSATVLHHALPGSVTGVSSPSTLGHLSQHQEVGRENQVEQTTSLLRDVIGSSEGRGYASAHQRQRAADMGVPGLADVMAAAAAAEGR